MVNFKVSDDEMELLQALVKRRGLENVTELIREAINEYHSRHG